MSTNDETLKENADHVMDELTELLVKNNINEFVICYRLNNSQTIYFPANMSVYDSAKMASYARKELATIVTKNIN